MKKENWWVTQGDKHILLNTARTKYACAYCGKFLGMIIRQYREVEVGPNKADSRKTMQLQSKKKSQSP